MNIFQDNWNIIEKRFPDITKKLKHVKPAEIQSTLTASGYKTISCGGNRIHSFHDPKHEAIIQTSHLESAKNIQSFGIGLGYQIETLFEQYPSRQITGYILNRAIFKACLSLKKMTFLSNPGFSLKYENVQENFQDFSVNPALIQKAETELYPLRDKLRQRLRLNWVNKYWEEKEEELRSNVKENTSLIKNDLKLEHLIQEQYGKNKHALIIGAGPSLDRYIDKIAESQDQFFIISLDAAYPACAKHNIIPDIVVKLDHMEIDQIFFHKISVTGTKTRLLYFPTVFPAILKNWKNDRIIAFNEVSGKFGFGDQKNMLETEGSVIHPALDLCKKLGIEAVVLAGVDFSLPDGINYEKNSQMRKEIKSIYLVNIKSWSGGQVPSSQNYIEYLRDTENYIRKNRDLQFINVSEIGAYIEGADHHNFDQMKVTLNIG